MINWEKIGTDISVATRTRFVFNRATQLAGGDSNQAWRLSGSTKSDKNQREIYYMVKLNAVNRVDMFAAESAGLAAIGATQTIRVPRTITHGVTDQHSFLVLEYFNLASHGDSRYLGAQIAAMHRHHTAQFGWARDNTIGVTPQINHWSSDWMNFWREQRLGFQLNLAAQNGYRGDLQKLGKQVLDALPDLLADHYPQPSLLHGDLWGGNHAFLPDGTPVLFDPATYYGDREADIAMTELFGGFDPEFFSAYQQAYPLDSGYAKRKTLYNLYHILNHCNMVSSRYVSQAERMMRGILGKTK
jgi:fructosamine-3-kinase